MLPNPPQCATDDAHPTAMLSPFQQRCQAAKRKPFRSEKPMVGKPSCTWKDFRRPLLRQFALEGEFEWVPRLGHGLDGIVWKVKIREQMFAIKVFWDNVAPEDPLRYWALQRECQNSALLRMIQYAIADSPVFVHPNPQTREEAIANLYAFSDDGRQHKPQPGSTLQISMPQMKTCFGWTMIRGEELCDLPERLRPPTDTLDGIRREISPRENYFAVMYEFIPEMEELSVEVIQSQLDLYWLVGFSVAPIRIENWKGRGVLIDMSEIICPWAAGWSKARYKRSIAMDWFPDIKSVVAENLDVTSETESTA